MIYYFFDVLKMSDIQNIINNDLDMSYDIKLFTTKEEKTQVKNTVNVKCPTCQSDNINLVQKQTRSGDEGATNFYTCLDCGFRWRRNN